MISLSYEKTKKDYYQTELLYSLNSWPIFLAVAMVIFPISCCFSNLIFSKTDILPLSGWGLSLIFLGTLILPVFILLIIIIKILIRGNVYIKNPEISMDINLEKVHIKNNLIDIQYQWENFSNMLESKDLFLLIFSANQRVTIPIPKRAFTSEEQLQEFRELLEEKAIGKLKPFNKSNNRILLIFIVPMILLLLFPCLGLVAGIILMLLGVY